MMQLFEDVSGTLAVLLLSIIGWIISKWAHGRFAAFTRTREAELVKLLKIGADSDDSLLADSANGEHEVPRLPLAPSNLDADATEKSPQLSVQNRRRVRRRAKAAKLEADLRPVESAMVMSSQGERSDTFTSHCDQKYASAVVVAPIAPIEEQLDESNADLVVFVPETAADHFPAKEELSEKWHLDEEVLSSPESLHTQRTETGLPDETKLSPRSVSNYPGGEEEKQDASLQSGSSTLGDAQETVSREDENSMLGKSSWPSASRGSSEPTSSIPMYPSCMSSADSCFHIHGDGWMTSFEELQFAQYSGELSKGTMTSLFGQQQMVGDAQVSTSYPEGELVYDSSEQTPVSVIHSEHAFVIEGRVFTPFTDVRGQHFYTDGEIVYDATCVLADSALTPTPNRSAEGIDGISDVFGFSVEDEHV